jgi:hypothetical protein
MFRVRVAYSDMFFLARGYPGHFKLSSLLILVSREISYCVEVNSSHNPKPSSAMRYYEARYPEVDELVMVQVRQIAEMGAYVKLVRSLQVSPPSPHGYDATMRKE